MQVYHGKSVYGGIAIGKIKLWKKHNKEIPCYMIENPEVEFLRFSSACKKAKEQLEELKKKALVEVGKENAEIFEIHKLMLEDSDYLESVQHIIFSEKLNSEHAVSATAEKFSTFFSSMDDQYMQSRALDVKDVSDRIINILLEKEENTIFFEDSVIIVAEDLTPSETLQLDKSKTLAFVTSKGSLNSHTAILARTMNIPAIIGVESVTNIFSDGVLAIVDGFSGDVYLDPDEIFLKESYERLEKEKEKNDLLKTLKGKENITLDGKKIELFANIGNIKFEISPNSFFQINPIQTEVLYQKAKDIANFKKTDNIADLYCGIGSIGLFMADSVNSVVGVEIVPDAVKDAEKNKKLNNIENAEFFCGEAENIMPELIKEKNFDAVVIDPPRKGCDEKLIDCLNKLKVPKIIYISCNPATLARDLKRLSENYKAEEIFPVDMFPNTVHVESVALLTLSN